MGSEVVINFSKTSNDGEVSLAGIQLGFSALRLFDNSTKEQIETVLSIVAEYEKGFRKRKIAPAMS